MSEVRASNKSSKVAGTASGSWQSLDARMRNTGFTLTEPGRGVLGRRAVESTAHIQRSDL